jgi:hypothetical protein
MQESKRGRKKNFLILEPLLELGIFGLWGPFGVRKREDVFFRTLGQTLDAN